LILAKREILAKIFEFRVEIIISDDCDKANKNNKNLKNEKILIHKPIIS
jgi:hypothetical protein